MSTKTVIYIVIGVALIIGGYFIYQKLFSAAAKYAASPAGKAAAILSASAWANTAQYYGPTGDDLQDPTKPWDAKTNPEIGAGTGY